MDSRARTTARALRWGAISKRLYLHCFVHGKHETAQRVLPLAIGAAYASDALQSGTSPTRLLIRDADGVGQRAVEVQEPALGRVDCRKEDNVEGEEQVPQRVEDGQVKQVLLLLEEEGQRSLPQ